VQTIHLGWWLLPRKSFLCFLYIIPLVFLKSRGFFGTGWLLLFHSILLTQAEKTPSLYTAWWQLVMKSFPMFLHNFLIFFGMLICIFHSILWTQAEKRPSPYTKDDDLFPGSPSLHCFLYNPPLASLKSKDFSGTLVLPKSRGFSGTLICYFIYFTDNRLRKHLNLIFCFLETFPYATVTA